jgi:hypothetical protein
MKKHKDEIVYIYYSKKQHDSLFTNLERIFNR